MVLDIHGEKIGYVWYSCLDIGAFAAVGYVSGRVVNLIVKSASALSFFKNPSQTDLTSAAVCCALFATIDRINQFILYWMFEESSNKPIYSALRIGVSVTIAVGLFKHLASSVKLSSMESKPATAIILTAIVIYSQMLLCLDIFNERIPARVYYAFD